MKSYIKKFFKSRGGILLTILIVILLLGLIFGKFLYAKIFESYTGVKNAKLIYDSSVKISDAEFEKLALEVTYQARLRKAQQIAQSEPNEVARRVKIEILLNTPSFVNETEFSHIKYFRNAGIRQYEGPKTCLKCHKTITVHKEDGTTIKVNTLEDVVNTTHFRFQSTASGFTTYGFNAKRVNQGARPIPVGKIDRACGIPGSFSWTGWAELIETKPEHLHGKVELRSEGCGQCHIGGNYHPATEKMMPIGDVPDVAKEGIDCLICHSQMYDMNYKYVIKDKVGTRWNQDRSMKAAITVTNPKNENCLNCHQHNMGGDAYKYNASAQNLGYKNKRILHEGSKRGNPFSREDDVHYSAGIQCLDCHRPEGHKIPRGTKGTDLVSNDLPGKEVSCENCHTTAPHTKNNLSRVILNGHTARLSCEACHIKDLLDINVVLRDWVNPTWNAEEGMYTPTDILRSGEVGIGFDFFWYNGNGTFLANALGNNPNKTDKYEPLMTQLVNIDNPKFIQMVRENAKRELKKDSIEVEKYLTPIINTLSPLSSEMIEKRKSYLERLRTVRNQGESKIYPFKLFNAQMYEDMSNQGPFGAMILPFDYSTYYQTGKTLEAVKVAIQNPIVKRMYETPFKIYMMDAFMHYFGVDTWKTEYPIDDKGNLRNVEPHWMRQYATLMINHGIQRDGRKCAECHSPNGIMNFEKLGYAPERVKDLINLPELKHFKQL